MPLHLTRCKTSGIAVRKLEFKGLGKSLTSRTDTVVQFLWHDDLVSVARFIADCFDHLRVALLHRNQP
jgi:hypothetical protein